MLLRLGVAFVILLQAFSAYAGGVSGIVHNEDSEQIISNPEQSFMERNREDAEALFKDSSLDQDFNGKSLMVIRVKGDFNNDGKPDEMLASSVNVGNGGGPFELYLGGEHGGFHDIGSVAMNASAHIIPLGKGSAKMLTCWHMSARECNPYGYILSGYEIQDIAKKDLPSHVTDENEDSPAVREFLEYNTDVDMCRWKDWLRTGHCEWHTLQEWRELDQVLKRKNESGSVR